MDRSSLPWFGRAWLAVLALALAALACVSEATTVDAGSNDEGTSGDDPDAQLCLDFCLSGDALGCSPPWAGVRCYSYCMKILADIAGQPCEAQRRAVMACEAAAEARPESRCETFECVDEYKRHNLCGGWCTHLGGSTGSGATPTQCRWRGTCYEHEFEVLCPAGAATGSCECLVDGELVDECEPDEPLPVLTCDPDIHVFTSCCRDAFAGILLP